jgi:hypothetical protein
MVSNGANNTYSLEVLRTNVIGAARAVVEERVVWL